MVALIVFSALLVQAPYALAAPSGSITGKVRLSRMGKGQADASGVVVYAVGFNQPANTISPAGLTTGAPVRWFASRPASCWSQP